MLNRLLFGMSLCLLTIAGCSTGDDQNEATTGSGSSAAENAPSHRTIGYSALTFTNPFFKVIADSMRDEAARHGFELLVVSGEQDARRQADQIDDFIVKGVSAIVLNPCDSKAIGPAIRRANEAGIPVFTNDLAYDGDDAEVVCHIATDNYQGGKLAGEAMVKLLSETGGKVAILHFAQAESCQQRVKGFLEVIEAHNAAAGAAKIQIVATLESNASRDQGQKAARDAIEANPDLAAIFAINDPAGLGAYAAVKAADKLDQVRIIAFDGQLIGKQAILEGKIVCDPIQFPDQIGRRTVEMIVRHFDGEEVPREVLIPSALYYKADAENDPELRAAAASGE